MSHLRQATAADAEAVRAVTRRATAGYGDFAGPDYRPPRDTPEAIATRLAGGWGVVAEAEGHVVGFGAFEPARTEVRSGALVPGLAHVWAVFVLEAHWGDGTARALLTELTAEMRHRQYEEARLFTPAGQTRARRFYAREGWFEQGPAVFVKELGLDVVELRRRL